MPQSTRISGAGGRQEELGAGDRRGGAQELKLHRQIVHPGGRWRLKATQSVARLRVRYDPADARPVVLPLGGPATAEADRRAAPLRAGDRADGRRRPRAGAVGGVPPGHPRRTGLELGTVSILLGVPILLMWLPLREQPGIGTVLNILVIGAATNVALGVLPAPPTFPLQLAMMALGVVTIGVASGIYLATDLGAGPRDGLMTGLHHRFGWSIRRARTRRRTDRARRRVPAGRDGRPGHGGVRAGDRPDRAVVAGHLRPVGAVARRRAAALGPAPVPSSKVLEGPAE